MVGHTVQLLFHWCHQVVNVIGPQEMVYRCNICSSSIPGMQERFGVCPTAVVTTDFSQLVKKDLVVDHKIWVMGHTSSTCWRNPMQCMVNHLYQCIIPFAFCTGKRCLLLPCNIQQGDPGDGIEDTEILCQCIACFWPILVINHWQSWILIAIFLLLHCMDRLDILDGNVSWLVQM